MTCRVWVTRAAPLNHLTVKRLAAAGYDAIGAPAIDIVPLAVPPVVPVPDALLFTSLNGIRLHRFLPGLADLPVLAVGDHSARYARARGYRRVVSARGNVQDLCHLIKTEFKGGANLLHIGAVHTASDLTVMLGREFHVRRLAVYDIKEQDPRDLEWVCGRLDDFDHVLVHSPRAGRFVAQLIDFAVPDWAGAIHCISAAAAAPQRADRHRGAPRRAIASEIASAAEILARFEFRRGPLACDRPGRAIAIMNGTNGFRSRFDRLKVLLLHR